jgi:hypothetical protein
MSDFYGLPTAQLENRFIRLEYLINAGPRLVRLSYLGGPNLFAELPQIQVETPVGPFYFRGGHRLWRSPEIMPETYFPDNTGLQVEKIVDGARLIQEAGGESGVTKRMDIHLSPDAPSLTIQHELRNEGNKTLNLAPWALTMFRLGGTAIMPQPVGASDPQGFLYNRLLALWPYTRIRDPRLLLHDDFLLVRAVPALPPVKIGCLNPAGWTAYWNEKLLFRKRVEVHTDALYPDGGCNSEIYCNDRFVELESLGPLVLLGPGQAASLTETWEIYDHLKQEFIPEALHEFLV